MTNGAGTNSRTLRVDDAGYFFSGEGDPWNVPGTVADVIYIEGSGSVMIESINHDTNTITLVSPRTWGDNSKVYHKLYSGSAPDIGAFESPYSSAGSMSFFSRILEWVKSFF